MLEISLTRNNNQAIISVKDQGPGIPPAEHAKLFKWFGRTSVQSTGNEKSTGLGLAIAQRIMQAHNGKIWVESQFGSGSTFCVSLPTLPL